MKKFFTYPVFLVIVLSIIGSIFFGSLLRHHYLGGERFQSLQKTAVFIATIPSTVKTMIERRTINLDKLNSLKKHTDKKRFVQFIPNRRNALLVLPRYNSSISRSIVEIIDLNNFKVIHTYKHDISEMNKQVQNIKRFPRLSIDHSPARFLYQNPLILDDGSLIGDSGNSPIFRIDFCSNLKWINDEFGFSHSSNFDHEGNIWVGGKDRPNSKYTIKYQIPDYNYISEDGTEVKHFKDDLILKINTDGKILYKKSIIEILIENKIVPDNFAFVTAKANEYDPIHSNDIQPTLSDTEYWKKGDVFISSKRQSSIIHYRPSINKVINYITGPFSQQHDVDIISDKEISIFNNNNDYVDNEYSEVLIYNFETNKYTKLFNDQLKKENFKTFSQGLSHIFKDGALMVEEQNHGRIILFNNKGEKEWEYVNIHDNGEIGQVVWSRIIEDELFIKKFKSLVENKKCTN